MNISFEIVGFTAAPRGCVKVTLASRKYDTQAKLVLTTSRINDLVVGSKIGDVVEVTVQRRRK